MITQPQKEHEWLQKLVGEWTYESECIMGPGKPPEKFTGTETVRSIGDLWVLCEGRGEMPGSSVANTWMMTLGYDLQRKHYVGTWIGSMMAYLWIYEGSLDTAEKLLTLSTEGPSPAADQSAKYRDVIEIKGDEQRVLTSYMLADDGQWQQFVTTNYRRKQ